MMFWTFAPYLLQILKREGCTQEEAMNKIFKWAKTGKSTGTDQKDKINDVNLEGLEDYTFGWILDEDPNHISHQFTKQEARKIAKILMEQESEHIL